MLEILMSAMNIKIRDTSKEGFTAKRRIQNVSRKNQYSRSE
jgi:hypothetical protein